MFSHPALKFFVWSTVSIISLGFVGYAYSQSVPPSGGACTKYVSPSGSLAGNTAYTTIQSGVDTLVPGDVLCVGPGTYREVIRVRNSGTAAERIVIRAHDPQNKPVIDAAYELPGGDGWYCQEYWENPNANLGPWPTRACAAPMRGGDPREGPDSNAYLVGIHGNHVTWDGIDITRSRGIGLLLGNGYGSGQYVQDRDNPPWYYDMQVYRTNVTHVRSTGILVLHVDGVVFEGGSMLDSNNGMYYDRSGWTWECEDDVPSCAGLAWSNNVALVGRNIRIENNVIGRAFAEGIQVGGFVLNPPGTFSSADNLIIRGNTLFDTWSGPLYIGNTTNALIENNVIYSSGDRTFFWRGETANPCVGIASENDVGSRNVTFRNNIVSGCVKLLGVHAYGLLGPDDSTYSDYLFTNNTFINPRSPWSGYASILSVNSPSLRNFTFQNNLLYHGDGRIADEFIAPPGLAVGNNYFSQDPPGALQGAGDIIGGSPEIANTTYQPTPGGAFDTQTIRLNGGSALIDAGRAVAGAIGDFFGGARPTGPAFDIGAHEFGSTPGTVTPPPPVFTGGGTTPPPPPPPPRFSMGQTVLTTASVNIRATPSTSGTIVTTQAAQQAGVVVGGPVSQGGFTWWQVQYNNGPLGWTAENYLQGNTTLVQNNWCYMNGLASSTPGGMCDYVRNESLRVGISTAPGDISAMTNSGGPGVQDILGYCGNADTFGTGRTEILLKTSGVAGPGECVIRPNVDYFVNVGTNISYLPLRPQQTQEEYAVLFTRLPGPTAGVPPVMPTYSGQPPVNNSPSPSPMTPRPPTSFTPPVYPPLPVGMTEVRPTETTDLLHNPGIGITDFYGGALDESQQPRSMVYYIRWYWTDFEPQEGQYNWAGTFDAAISEARRRGQTLDWRIMPNAPDWMIAQGVNTISMNDPLERNIPDHNDPVFMASVERGLRAISERYGDSPDFNMIDINFVGRWGEWHNYTGDARQDLANSYLPTQENARRIIDWHFQYFPNTPKTVLVGYLTAYNDVGNALPRGAGWRADCYGDLEWHHPNVYRPSASGIANTAWQYGPVSMETCGVMSDWPGWQVNTEADLDLILSEAYEWHVSTFNNKSSPIPPQWRAKVDEWLKYIGYRFALNFIQHTSSVAAGGQLQMNTYWINRGVAPAYHRYPIAYRLRSGSGVVVAEWQSTQDIREWLPGFHRLDGSFTVPGGIPGGAYALDVAILDRYPGRPPLELAMQNRGWDGWYNVSTINVQ
jgi:hypothetical protein